MLKNSCFICGEWGGGGGGGGGDEVCVRGEGGGGALNQKGEEFMLQLW